MKKVNTMEMRTVEGGYRVKCRRCGKTSGSVSAIGSSLFWAKHTMWCGKKYVVWDTSYRNADKWYS